MMEDFLFDGEDKLPTIDLKSQTGLLTFSGRCVPENSVGFFEPIFDWITEYANSPQDETTVDLYFDYFNTSSAKMIFDLFKQLEAIHEEGKTKIKVIWRYEEYDQDLQEAGEDYAALAKLPFDLVQMAE